VKICVIGLGQIGGSLASGLRQSGEWVYGISKKKETVDYAIRNNIIDDGATEINLREIDNFDVIFLAVHLGLYEEYIKRLRQFSGILSDVGSVKRTFYTLSKKSGIRFVGCHPIAGTEKSGITSADPNIFKGKYCIISGWSDKSSKEVVEGLWKKIGAETICMSPKYHDKLLCAISHLPHIIAFTLVNSTYGIRKGYKEIFGGSFRDITRVAQSPAQMWVDIFLQNSDYIIKQTEKQLAEMQKILMMIKNKQKNKILKYIMKSKEKI